MCILFRYGLTPECVTAECNCCFTLLCCTAQKFFPRSSCTSAATMTTATMAFAKIGRSRWCPAGRAWMLLLAALFCVGESMARGATLQVEAVEEGAELQISWAPLR